MGEPWCACRDELSARQCGARAFCKWLGEAEIDRVVFRKASVEHDVVQAALAYRKDLWQAGRAPRKLAVAGGDPHPAGSLREEDAAVRQEGERPGIADPAY